MSRTTGWRRDRLEVESRQYAPGLGTNQIAKRMFSVFFFLLPHFQHWMLSLLPYLRGEASSCPARDPTDPTRGSSLTGTLARHPELP